MSVTSTRRCSGIRLLLPMVMMLSVYALIEIVEGLSPFAGFGDLRGYYAISAVYAFFGCFLVLPFAFVHYEARITSQLLIRARQYADVCICVAGLGLLFLAFDRMFIQGVDYSGGISAARENWREIATSRGGVSSPFSVFGNLMYPTVFVSLLLSIVFYDFLRGSMLRIIGGAIIVFGFSLLIGGRTSILVFLCVILGGLNVRVLLGQRFFPRKFFKYCLIMFSACVFFAGLIFFWRMSGSNVGFDSYALSLVARHNGYVRAGVELGDVSMLDALIYSLAVYFVHVKWIFQAVLSDSYLHGHAFLNQVFWILSTRGGLDFGIDYNWTYSGRWISLAGAVWHDYGVFGASFISLALYSISALIICGCIFLRKLSVDTSISVIVMAGAFFAFFIVSPFASLLEVVEYIYFSFGVVVLVLFGVFRDLMMRVLK